MKQNQTNLAISLLLYWSPFSKGSLLLDGGEGTHDQPTTPIASFSFAV